MRPRKSFLDVQERQRRNRLRQMRLNLNPDENNLDVNNEFDNNELTEAFPQEFDNGPNIDDIQADEEINDILENMNDILEGQDFVLDDGENVDELLENDNEDDDDMVLENLSDDDDEVEIENADAEEDDNQNNDFNGENVDDVPLYDNASITIKESMSSILSVMVRNNLSMTCVADIIDLIELHCPTDGLVRNSLYKFRKFFSLDDNPQVKKHFYCSSCLREKVNANDRCNDCEASKIDYFVEFPYKKQLQSMYFRHSFVNKLQSTYVRRTEQRNIISDIYDGSIYKSQVENGFLRNRNNISFMWYSDAFPVFVSSRTSVTSFCLRINELPSNERCKRENIIMLAAWFGKVKIHFNYVLHKLFDKLEELYNGIDIMLPEHRIITVRGVILFGTCDLPAKSDCLNFTQHNGFYGCPVCYMPGESSSIGPNSHVHSYIGVEPYDLRTSEGSLIDANSAVNGELSYGVKGHTGLSRVMPDFIGGMGIDRMHGVEGGTWLKLLTLWFTPKYSGSDFSFIDRVDEVNRRLRSIKPPKFVHRMPRDLGDLIHWKASELKMFLFYYAIAVLKDILDIDRFNHLLMLIIGMKMLSSDTITPDMIKRANNLLQKFVESFPDLYGGQFSTINVHSSLHMSDCVQRIGPLWAYTCYEFEDLNGKLLRSIHGTRCIDTQLASSHSNVINMMRYIEELPENNVREFCLKRKKQVKITLNIDDHTFAVGALTKYPDIPPHIVLAFRDILIDINAVHVRKYLRLLKDKKLYVSESYTRRMQTQSSVIQYAIYNEFFYGNIICFVQTTDHVNGCRRRNCVCVPSHFAVIQDIEIINPYSVTIENNNIFECSTTEDYVYNCRKIDNHRVIPVNSIRNVCFFMEINGQSHIAIPINAYEIE